MQCARCGTVGYPDDLYCTNCGEYLPPLATEGEPVGFVPRLAPPDGLDAAATPGGPLTDRHLSGGTRLLMRRRSGPWAYVWEESGWMGWVEESLLVDPDFIDRGRPAD